MNKSLRDRVSEGQRFLHYAAGRYEDAQHALVRFRETRDARFRELAAKNASEPGVISSDNHWNTAKRLEEEENDLLLKVDQSRLVIREAELNLRLISPAAEDAAQRPKAAGMGVLNVLEQCKFFFSGESRHILDTAVVDLRRDIRSMNRRGMRVALIRLAVATQVVNIVCRLVRDAIRSLAENVVPILRVLRKSRDDNK